MAVGAAETVITPPLDVELAGYGPSLGRTASRIADHLFAQAVVLGEGSEAIALISCDLLALSADTVRGVRTRLNELEGLRPERVLVAATHSHTAPVAGITREWGRRDAAYADMAVRHLVGVTRAAATARRPAHAWLGRSEYRELAWNRTGRDEVDPAVRTLHFVDAEGEVLAAVVHHACHPVTLGPESAVSADFPGAMRAYLRDAHPRAVVAYLNGACADIDPITNRHAWASGTVEDVQAFGEGLGAAALAAMRAATPAEASGWTVRSSVIDLPFQPFEPDAHRAEAERRERELAARDGRPDDAFGAVDGQVEMPRFWATYHRDLLSRFERGRLPDRETIELQALCLGDDLALVAVPAEVYAEHGSAIAAASTAKDTWVVGYANGCSGYLPPQREFEAASYATRLAAAAYDRQPFAPDVAERLLDGTRRLLSGAPEEGTAGRERAGRHLPSDVPERYRRRVTECLHEAASAQQAEIERAAAFVADAVDRQGLVFVGGSGHSHILAEEVFYRAGGLLAIHPLLVSALMLHEGALRSSRLERLEGFAAVILDDAGVTDHDLLIVASNSGRNAVPVELALEARRRGCRVVAVTSTRHSRRVQSRHSSGRRLIDVADVILDNCAPYGDATVQPRGIEHAMGPVSTIVGSYLMHTLSMRAAELLAERGRPPAVMISANADERDPKAQQRLQHYRARVRHL